ncbi:MerR family transcriptional regulator [Virgibacillus byunsanensis]|uniref:MerR family transcriptional regulator n=1 Tax=Virgibacillus byunsanensis TaxID=570945 RepID=A0ABW3LQC2_9BACI
MDSFLSIGELAKQADVNPSTIRFYESIGIMPIPKRVNRQRRYTTEVIDQLKFIKTAQLAGFSNQEIIELLEGFNQASLSETWRKMANIKCAELEEQKKHIDAMLDVLQSGLECKCLTWSECHTKVNLNGTCCKEAMEG